MHLMVSFSWEIDIHRLHFEARPSQCTRNFCDVETLSISFFSLLVLKLFIIDTLIVYMC